MPVPDFRSLMLPLLRIASDGAEHRQSDAIDRLAREFRLTEDEVREQLPSGRAPRFANRVAWAATYLRKAGLLQKVRYGRPTVTERIRAKLAYAIPNGASLRSASLHSQSRMPTRNGATRGSCVRPRAVFA